MPYYSRRGYYRRRRRLWRRRPRKPFFRAFWRGRRYYKKRRRVRKYKRKLPYLLLKEWQPPRIVKLKIRGFVPLFITTDERLVNNFAMYSNEIAPHYYPGGGGFSILCFTLAAFYQLFKKVQCFWTQSNDDLPLVRYTGCTFKFFHSEKNDYITTYHACGSMKPALDTYNSTQPYIMTLNKRHRIIRCKQNNNIRKPYTKVKVKPPAQLTSKWFFQKEMAYTPLVMLMTSGMSTDRFYSYSTSQSTTIGFKAIDTNVFNYHNWEIDSTSGYKGSEGKWLWALQNGSTTKIHEEKVSNLIFLGETKLIKKGRTVGQTSTATTESFKTTWERYLQSSVDWGNPFEPTYLTQEVTVLFSNIPPKDIPTKYTNFSKDSKLEANFQTFTLPLVRECRYNPLADDGNNHIFIESITKHEQQPWKQATDPKLLGGEYPLWLGLWGFIDYKKNTIGKQVDTDYVLIIVSEHITPKLGFYLVIDEEFLQGRSKYVPTSEPVPIKDFDKLHWHPKVTFQLSTINRFGACGPGTLKLPKQISAEAHCGFTFYFKLGGCGPKMSTIEDPEDQPVYPTPNNILSTTSLQNPEYPPEHFLYSFDQRRDQITKRAAERISSILSTKAPLSPIAGRNLLHQTTQSQTSSQETETKETQTETLLQLIRQQQHRQQHLRKRILQLISTLK
nr:MAG: ORF1 [TTV-like mini virus]